MGDGQVRTPPKLRNCRRFPLAHSIILSYGNALNFQRKFFPYPMKNRLADPSEICALDFKHEFGRSAICSVSATIGIDRSILADSARTTGWTGSRKKTVSPSSDDQLDEISPSAI